MFWVDFRYLFEFIKDTFKYILIIIIVLFIVIYVVSLQHIIGDSMNPTLKDGDVLVLDKLHYKLFDIKRNDIIAFDNDATKYLVKRIIGLPGENIVYKDNILYVNGKKTTEKIDDLITSDFSLSSLGYDKIPDDMYLVLGDNRGNSIDSRVFGLIEKKDIIGKAFIRIWPINGLKII
jgi:signal peptidase I